MPTKQIGGRDFEIGVLNPETVKVYPEPAGAYYSLIVGKNPDEQERSIITRGAGKQWGATRVPLQISVVMAEKLRQRGLGTRPWSYSDMMRKLGHVGTMDEIQVLLVQMPREGNFISGLEWNAPGGTQELGEAPEDIATREFGEESDLTALWTGSDFPAWMQHASGCYDEVQYLSVALVTGSPTKLVEGARRWIALPLDSFNGWAHSQNQLDDPFVWETEKFCPVDGKVYSLVRCVAADIELRNR